MPIIVGVPPSVFVLDSKFGEEKFGGFDFLFFELLSRERTVGVKFRQYSVACHHEVKGVSVFLVANDLAEYCSAVVPSGFLAKELACGVLRSLSIVRLSFRREHLAEVFGW